MKRLVYSVWDSLTESHMSADDYKQEQFRKHYDELVKVKKEYADLCKADYQVFEAGCGKYQDIQFSKIDRFCEVAEEYDEILYLDLDVIPNTDEIIFDRFDLSKMCMHFKVPSHVPTQKELRYMFKDNREWSYMNSWIKVLIKKSMLALDNINGSDLYGNTGVMVSSSEAVKGLREKMENAHRIYEEAYEDNFHPDSILKAWTKNNEVFISYILEKESYNEIGQAWNYILDDKVTKYTPAAHFIHQVNKNFEDTFNAMGR